MLHGSDSDLFERSLTEDRPLLSANDWWGAGFLEAMEAPIVEAKKRVRWYCGKVGAYEQYEAGRYWGATLRAVFES